MSIISMTNPFTGAVTQVDSNESQQTHGVDSKGNSLGVVLLGTAFANTPSPPSPTGWLWDFHTSNWNYVVTPEDMFAQSEAAIQAVLDKKAQERSYTDMNSACKYAASSPILDASNEHYKQAESFRLEANALKVWVFLTWAGAYAYRATVIAGTNPMPTTAQVVSMIPTFIWPD